MKPPGRSEASPVVDLKLARAERSCSGPVRSWCGAGARPRGASSGLCPLPAGFPGGGGGGGGAKACTQGGLESERTSHTAPRRPGWERRGGLVPSSERCIPPAPTRMAPRGSRTHLGWPSWAGWLSRGRGKEAHRRGRGLRPPRREDLSPRGSRREMLFVAAGGPSSPLRSRERRPRTAWC